MNVAGFSKSSARLSSPMTVFKLNTFCIVTGASRGLGREIALQLVQGWIREGEWYVLRIPKVVALGSVGVGILRRIARCGGDDLPVRY